MRVLIVLAAVVILFALVGWITFSNDAGRSSINLETEEIREDTGELMQRSSEALRDVEDELAPERDETPQTSTTD